jgi:hypothetical protein
VLLFPATAFSAFLTSIAPRRHENVRPAR